MYELRDLDVGGPDFVYPPPPLAAARGRLRRSRSISTAWRPRALLAYPLIVTRRDPAASRPPSAYSLLWQGAYYQVWGRRPGAPAAAAHVALAGLAGAAVRAHRAVARSRSASASGERLIAAESPRAGAGSRCARSSHPRRWGHEREGLVMSTPGRLSAELRAAAAPACGMCGSRARSCRRVRAERGRAGRSRRSPGSSTATRSCRTPSPPVTVRLGAGRAPRVGDAAGFTLAAGRRWRGDPRRDLPHARRRRRAGHAAWRRAVAHWRTLCGRSYQWVELVALPSARARQASRRRATCTPSELYPD